MKISFQSKGDFGNVLSWLNKASKQTPSSALSQIASEGRQALAANTPRDTGETASGWVSEITSKNGKHEIVWKNAAHPEEEVNMAKLIEIGHATRTGGYVPPQPYIKQAMAPIWRTAGDRVTKEMIE